MQSWAGLSVGHKATKTKEEPVYDDYLDAIDRLRTNQGEESL